MNVNQCVSVISLRPWGEHPIQSGGLHGRAADGNRWPAGSRARFNQHLRAAKSHDEHEHEAIHTIDERLAVPCPAVLSGYGFGSGGTLVS
jgi:hypothetical protein